MKVLHDQRVITLNSGCLVRNSLTASNGPVLCHLDILVSCLGWERALKCGFRLTCCWGIAQDTDEPHHQSTRSIMFSQDHTARTSTMQ